MIKKILLRTALGIIILVFVIFNIIVTILNWPTLIINETAFKYGASIAEKFGYKITFDSVNTSAQSKGFIDENLSIEINKLCIKTDDTSIDACFEDFSLAFRYSFSWYIPRIKSIGPITISSQAISYKLSEEKPKKKNPNPQINIPEIVLPSIIKNSDFFPISITVSKFNIIDNKESIRGNIDLQGKTDDKKQLTALNLKGNVHLSGMNINLNTDITSVSGFKKDDVELKTITSITSSDGWNAKADLSAKKSNKKTLEAEATLNYNAQGLGTKADLKTTLNNEIIKTDLTFSVSNIDSPVNSLQGGNCALTLKRTSKRENKGKLDLHCGMNAYLQTIQIPEEVEDIYTLPEVIKLAVKANLDTFFIPNPDKNIKGKVNIDMGSVQSHMISTKGNINLDLNGNLENFPDKMQISSNMDIDFKLTDFQRLVATLRNGSYAIPAPLNALGGTVTLSLKGNIPSLSSRAHFPVNFETALETIDERIFFRTKGEAQIDLVRNKLTGVDVTMNIELDEVEIPLPTLSIAGIPRFSPDSRILLKPKDTTKKETPFEYHLTIETKNSVKITSNLAEKPIPINLDLKATTEALLGDVKIESFPVRLFNKRALIKSLEFKLNNPMKYTEVQGVFEIRANIYTISVNIGGTLQNPSVWFESNPPLSEDNIIAVLLYGEPFEDLDDDKASSVGNMKAATSNKALALVSFFVLASTPIQNIAYNPDTKSIVARFKLSDKTSLSVGKEDKDTSQVGIRQRLGGGWMINTTVSNNTEDETTSAAAFVEWHKRY